MAETRNITDPIRLRHLVRNRVWKTPEAALAIARSTGAVWRGDAGSPTCHNEMAAIFVYGLSRVLDTARYEISLGEDPIYPDTDFYLRADLGENKSWAYRPVQLKRLVPERLAPAQSFQSLLDGLKKYVTRPGQESLIVALFVARTGCLEIKELDFSGIQVDQVWFYGFKEQRMQMCTIAGYFLDGGGPFPFDFLCPP
jgi:hypothetical protein